MAVRLHLKSATILQRYGVALGNVYPQSDPEWLLRHTLFKPVHPIFDRKAIVHWFTTVYVPGGTAEEETLSHVWSNWAHAAYRYFKYVRPIGAYDTGGQQALVGFQVCSDDPVKAIVAEVKLWLPYLLPASAIAGVPKRVTLCIGRQANGTCWAYELAIVHKTHYQISSLFTPQIPCASFGTLKAAVTFIRQHMWWCEKRKQANA